MATTAAAARGAARGASSARRGARSGAPSRAPRTPAGAMRAELATRAPEPACTRSAGPAAKQPGREAAPAGRGAGAARCDAQLPLKAATEAAIAPAGGCAATRGCWLLRPAAGAALRATEATCNGGERGCLTKSSALPECHSTNAPSAYRTRGPAQRACCSRRLPARARGALAPRRRRASVAGFLEP